MTTGPDPSPVAEDRSSRPDLPARTLSWSPAPRLFFGAVVVVAALRLTLGLAGGESPDISMLLMSAALVLGVFLHLRSPRLRVDARGLSVRVPTGSIHETWTTCGDFTAVRVGRRLAVGLRADAHRAAHPGRASRARARHGVDVHLEIPVGGLSPAQIVAMLQAYRDAYGPPADASRDSAAPRA